jgi:hypothetical protein
MINNDSLGKIVLRINEPHKDIDGLGVMKEIVPCAVKNLQIVKLIANFDSIKDWHRNSI